MRKQSKNMRQLLPTEMKDRHKERSYQKIQASEARNSPELYLKRSPDSVVGDYTTSYKSGESWFDRRQGQEILLSRTDRYRLHTPIQLVPVLSRR
jgi:hypothetical protein